MKKKLELRKSVLEKRGDNPKIRLRIDFLIAKKGLFQQGNTRRRENYVNEENLLFRGRYAK